MARKWVDLTGVKEFRAALKAIPVEERKAIRKVVRETGRKVRDAARARAPRLTGDLVKSINSKSSKSGMAAKIGTAIPYGPYVEFGTNDTAAKPFLFPSLEEQRNTFPSELKQAIDAANKAAAK